jgi:hypothetical protein
MLCYFIFHIGSLQELPHTMLWPRGAPFGRLSQHDAVVHTGMGIILPAEVMDGGQAELVLRAICKGNIQWTFSEHSVDHSVLVQWKFSEN